MNGFRKIIIFIFVFLLNAEAAVCQVFGSSLDLMIKETNARTAAIGGFNVSLMDEDVQMISGNPALANGRMAKTLGLTYNPSLAGIRQYNTAYCDSFNLGTRENIPGLFFTNLQYMDYGSFQRRDAAGIPEGNFSASQYCISAGSARQRGNFRLGAALKFASLQIDQLQAAAICADLGLHYRHPKKEFQFGFSIRNIGFQLQKFYSDGQSINIPLNIQTGISYRLKHMPLRISATAFYLQERDIQYLDPNIPGKLDLNGKLVKEEKKITEQIARHLSLGGEFLLHKAFHIRAGYNHLRRKELKTESGAGLTGYSLGFSINTRPVSIAYTWSGWQREVGMHYISMNLKINNFYRKI